MFQAIIFDMDGVLFDTEKVFNSVWQEVATTYQKELSQEMLDALRGTSGKKMDAIIEQYWSLVDGTLVREKLFETSYKRLQQEVPIKTGVYDLLNFLKTKGYPMAIASSSPKHLIMNNLKVSKLLNYFTVIVSGEEVKNGKPEPDIFLRAAEKLQIDPKKCLVLEDGIHGVLAAYKARCEVYMIPDLLQPNEEIINKKIPIYNTLFDVLISLQNQIEK